MIKLTSKRKRLFIILTSVVIALVIIRAALPFVVLHYANKTLSRVRGYYGRIQDIDVFVLRGAYKIDSIYLNKVDSVTQKQTPFLSASLVDLSVEWRALFHGSFVGEMTFHNPIVLFTKEKVDPSTLEKDSSDFEKLLDDFMPLRVNRFEVHNGSVRFKDDGSKPHVDIGLTKAHLIAQNLRNSYDSTSILPASIKANAVVYGGTLTFNMKLNPLAEYSTFDMNTELKNTNLVALNDFFQAYAGIDVNQGTFGMYAEAAAIDGKFIGYVKPIIKGLDIVGKEDRKDNIFQKIWEALVGGVAQVFKNQEENQLATKIPFKGSVGNPNANVWYAIVNILKNAFIHALAPSIDKEISIASIGNKKEKKTFMQKMSGKKEPDAKPRNP